MLRMPLCDLGQIVPFMSLNSWALWHLIMRPSQLHILVVVFSIGCLASIGWIDYMSRFITFTVCCVAKLGTVKSLLSAEEGEKANVLASVRRCLQERSQAGCL